MSATFAAHPRAIDQASTDALFREAHTGYAFTDDAVTDDQLAEIYDLVKYAPTSMNSQPLRITFIRSDEAKARLLPLLFEPNRPKSASAPVVAILAADTDFHEQLPRVLPQNPQAKDRFEDNDRRIGAAMSNANIQAGYFILAARAVGLDVGPMGGFDLAGVDAEFFAGTALKSFMVVNLGHVTPEGNFPRNPRLEHHEVVTTL
ncbi:unannotated protein [freshwater metagenome]|uniref:Unannotated protein n=1 Tax=freshwater metagenome TaxID=449393 RepID=A0A6J6LP12_9ZZZZ|nr:malonic semialdehyde reductase [Actinomycetota bacterium]MSY38461.1 malonic semialdehyde reductase [Actinomycetota bacterium]